jgi:predicted GIY-YIG superfamily endonuclease
VRRRLPPAREATQRERQLKGRQRAKKVALINAVNPSWRDLTAGEA